LTAKNNIYPLNFVGANHKLRVWSDLFQAEQHKKSIDDFLIQKGVQWKFIPPRSSHFGGLWEAADKSMKNLIQRTLGDAIRPIVVRKSQYCTIIVSVVCGLRTFEVCADFV